MIIAGFQILDTLYESEKTRVYLAMDTKSRSKVTIKMYAGNFPRPEDYERLQYEYNITSGLKTEGVVRPISLQKAGYNYVLVREYFEGSTLREIMNRHDKGEFPLEEFFQIAIKLSDLIGKLHEEGIIHNDINPSNLVYQNATGQIKILDFGIASFVGLASSTTSPTRKMEGTLAYISPEQTGRMNKHIDQRSDMYALGITFFEMLSGHKPFDGNDPNEIIYGHIAKTPVAITRYRPEMPEILEKIIFKLLAKSPEDRYQSAFGLRSDLERSFAYFTEQGEIPLFELATFDFSSHFQLSSKLYGRDREFQLFKRISDQSQISGTHLVKIVGPTGSGKSSYAQDCKGFLDFRKAGILEANFSDMQSDVPFYGWKKLFEHYLEDLMKKDEKFLQSLRNKLEEQIGNNMKVLGTLIPNLELLMGPLKNVPALSPSENQLRFNFVFRSFLKIISQKHNPLTIFLDNFHQADSASVYLLDVILEDAEIDHILIIANYSQQGVLENEALDKLLKKHQETYQLSHLSQYQFELAELTVEDIALILSDSVRMESGSIQNFAQLVYTKTQGNPLFVHQLIQAFYTSKTLYCDSQNMTWVLDEHKAFQWSISENVILLLTNKVDKCPQPISEILAFAAALKSDFTLDLLVKILDNTEEEIIEALEYGFKEGILLHPDNVTRFTDGESHKSKKPLIRFIHQGVTEAFEESLEKEKVGFIHFQAGRELLTLYKNDPDEVLLFRVLKHLNRVASHIVHEREELIKLNFEAGQKSKWACNYIASLQYFQMALDLLSEEDRQKDFDRYFHIEIARLESLYLIGKFEELDAKFELIYPLAISKQQKFSCLELKILSLKARQQLVEAIELIYLGFEMLGMKIPPKPSNFQLINLALKCRLMFEYWFRIGFDKLPEMQNENLILVDKFISVSISAIYFSNSKLVPYLLLYRVRNTLKFGHSTESPVIFASYSMILGVISGDFPKAIFAANYAQDLARSKRLIQTYTITDFICLSFRDIWLKRLREILPSLKECFEEGMKVGSIEYGSYALSNYTFFSFFAGNPLYQVSEECKTSAKQIIDYRQESTLRFFKMLQQFADIMIAAPLDQSELDGETFDKNEALQKYNTNKDQAGFLVFYTFELLICLINNKTQDIAQPLKQLLKNLDGTFASIFNIFGHYIAGLALLETSHTSSSISAKKEIKKRVNQYLKLLKKWSDKAPFNFCHMYLHLKAAYCLKFESKEKSLVLFEQALEQALINEKQMEAAMISESAALLCLELSMNIKAEFFIQKAYVNYRKWGAKSKAEDFVHNLNWKAALTFSPDNIHIGITQTRDFRKKGNYEFDMSSILKASQALATEIIASKLVDKLTAILLETAGAEKILLMENNDGHLHLLAEGYLRNNSVWVENYLEEKSKISIKEKQYYFEKGIKIKAPKSLLHFVLRTQQIYVDDHLSESRKFDEEEYILNFKPKSVLCFPVLHKGEIRNLIYMENNLVQGAFTPERVSLLEMISSQIAISLENSRLYQSLEDKVKERTSEVVKQKEIIEKKNEDITASINYGKRIQDALLPTKAQIKRTFDDAFVFFRPRDIVSGDFYWMKEVNGKTLLAIADCTGHGVPGAFVSLIGHNLLNEIVVQNEEISPALILKKLHNGLSHMLNSHSNTSHDGMDIGICVFDKSYNIMTYAGAKTPLLYIQEDKMYQIKGERCSLGDDTFPIDAFREHVISLDVPTTFYLFTDGFQDQFGGLQNKKYLINRLKTFLLKISTLSMAKQQTLLETEFKNWMGNEPQVDDVLVVGFKIE